MQAIDGELSNNQFDSTIPEISPFSEPLSEIFISRFGISSIEHLSKSTLKLT
jgi:hypothetical protein